MERTETQMKILEVGKKEFLEKGFKDASLNKIVAEAGFTKGAFYGYYPDKTALFEDLVGGTASELLTRFKAAQDDYFDLVPERKTKDSLELSTQHLHELVAFMYDHFDEFKLILCRAEGTGYADFIEVLVDLEICGSSGSKKPVPPFGGTGLILEDTAAYSFWSRAARFLPYQTTMPT